jgi:hypothetical protein
MRHMGYVLINGQPVCIHQAKVRRENDETRLVMDR